MLLRPAYQGYENHPFARQLLMPWPAIPRPRFPRFANAFLIFLASYQSLTLAGPSTPPPPPQKTPLAFSATPTAEEIFRSHIFEEPLVPVGREPTPLENAALASALIGYSKRSSVDDFVSLTTFLGSLITGLINSQGRST